MTWSVLALEIMFGPLCLFSRTRKWAWIAIIMMHIGILSTVQFADLTFGVLMFHLFTMEPTWFQKYRQHPLIVFYDGTCGFCQSSVQFIMDLDPNAHINFSPLQGTTAQNQIPSEILQKLDSIVVLDGEQLSTKSDAILRIGKRLGGWGVFIQIGYVFPRVFRNQLYDLIAKHRYLIMGKSEQCRIPSEKDLKRFIP
jgi:predicted DCC family thiol-disulfide oxidoreductase YuxK